MLYVILVFSACQALFETMSQWWENIAGLAKPGERWSDRLGSPGPLPLSI
jgi:hypothetical protein